jgi:drug/metabolite transporter (DMT)-like permease
MTTAPTARRYAGTGLLMLACVSWGLSTALTKIALDQLTPVDLFGIEIVVSAVPLVLLALARGARPGRPNPAVLLLGVLEPGLTYLLFDLGVRRTAASHAALLLALDAPVTLVLAVAFLRERVDLWLLASLAAGVGGSVLVTWRADGAGSSLTGDVLVIGSAVTAAAFAVLARHVAPTRDPVVVTAVQMLGALAVAMPIFGISAARGGSRIGDADAAHLILATMVGLLGGVIPFLLFNRAIAQLTASRASLIGVLVPVIGAGASVVLVGERITRLAALGGVLAVAGAALATRREDDSPSNDEETVPPIVLAVEEPCA